MIFKFKEKELELFVTGIARLGDTIVFQSEKKLSVEQYDRINANLENLKRMGLNFVVTEPPLRAAIIRGSVS